MFSKFHENRQVGSALMGSSSSAEIYQESHTLENIKKVVNEGEDEGTRKSSMLSSLRLPPPPPLPGAPNMFAAAIEAGFSKAFRTIVDANITTFIAAVVLFQFGTGPIKGFAITLCIGIAASMFTAVFVSRTFFDGTMSQKKLDKLSI